jgi:hypothetical protein
MMFLTEQQSQIDDDQLLRDRLYYTNPLYAVIINKTTKPITHYSHAPFELSSTVQVSFTNDVSVVNEWIQSNVHNVVAIDCEVDAYKCFSDGTVIHTVNTPDVIQLAVNDKVLLYQTNEGKDRPCVSFVQMLANDTVTKVFFDLNTVWKRLESWIKAHQLIKHLTNFSSRSRKSCYDVKSDSTSIADLCTKLLQRQMTRSDARYSRWSRSNLSLEQRGYAAKDVYVILLVYEKVIQEKPKVEREKQKLQIKENGVEFSLFTLHHLCQTKFKNDTPNYIFTGDQYSWICTCTLPDESVSVASPPKQTKKDAKIIAAQLMYKKLMDK